MAIFLVWFLIGLSRYYIPALDANIDSNCFDPPIILRPKRSHWRKRGTRNKEKRGIHTNF